jgi:hypothetical protein
VWTRNSQLILGLALALAACSGTDDRPPASSASGGTGGSGAGDARGGSQSSGGHSERGGSSNGGVDTDAGGAAGASSDSSGGVALEGGTSAAGEVGNGGGGEPGAGGGPVEKPTPAQCPNPMLIASSREVAASASASADSRLGGISADELSVAWLEATQSGVELHTATRANEDARFAAERSQALPAAFAGVALSPDGLRLAFVSADRRSFSVWNRGNTSEDFSDAGSSELAMVTGDEGLADEEELADPVFGPSDLTFVFSRFSGDRGRTLFSSARFSRQAPFAPGRALDVDPELEGSSEAHFVPTGLSADQRTLFIWSASQSSQFVSFFDVERQVYASPVALVDAPSALPNRDCTRLYHSTGSTRATIVESTLASESAAGNGD